MAYYNLGDTIKKKIDGIEISYDRIGSGEPMILLHGWGANKNTFSKLAIHLKDNFTVYSIDLPGFGETEIGLPLNLYEVVDLLYHFCCDMKIQSPIVLGHSYGGRLAIIYASKYPVKKLILVSAAGIRQPLSLKKRISVRMYKILKKCKIKVNMGSKDYINADNVKRKMLVDAIHTDLLNDMRKIEGVESLLLYGKNDETTPIQIGKKMEQNIKNSALIVIENCGHFPYLEQPTIFHLILDSFLVGSTK